tara:strand:- start:13 stop:153 length:141 start_codon:yes stop_codon:yes gene_type:complete
MKEQQKKLPLKLLLRRRRNRSPLHRLKLLKKILAQTQTPKKKPPET